MEDDANFTVDVELKKDDDENRLLACLRRAFPSLRVLGKRSHRIRLAPGASHSLTDIVKLGASFSLLNSDASVQLTSPDRTWGAYELACHSLTMQDGMEVRNDDPENSCTAVVTTYDDNNV